MNATIFEVLEQVSRTVPNCQYTSIVDMHTGMSVASVMASADPMSAEGADAYHGNVYHRVARALEALDASQGIESLVLHTESSVFISVPVPDSPYFWHVVTTSATTVGFTQAIMRKHQDTLLRTLSQLMM